MKTTRLLIGLLLLATVLVDGVVVSIVLSLGKLFQDPRALFWIFVLVALALAQSSLAAIWAGFGRRSIAWRAMALVLTITAWSRLMPWVINPSTPNRLATEWAVLLLAQTIIVFAGVIMARLAGVRVVSATEALPAANDADRHARFQFSLAYAFSWIIAVAVILGVLQYALYRQHVPPDADFWLSLAALSVAHALMAMAALWTALGTRWAAVRVFVLCATTLAAHAAHTYVWEEILVGATVCVVQVSWLLGSLWVIRVAGYRLVRQGRKAFY
jgi:hypothetical protein